MSEKKKIYIHEKDVRFEKQQKLCIKNCGISTKEGNPESHSGPNVPLHATDSSAEKHARLRKISSTLVLEARNYEMSMLTS